MLRLFIALIVGCGAVYAALGEPFGVLLVVTAIPCMLPLLLLSLPRHTLFCEAGVAPASGQAHWADIVTWQSYDRGKRLTVVAASTLWRLPELNFELVLQRNREAAMAILRERVPNGRVLP